MNAIFLDKDGTLIEDVPYNVDPAQIRLYPDVPEALRRFRDAGYRLIVISNQAGVARGYFEENALEGVRETLYRLLATEGVAVDGFYYCPHHPQGTVPVYSVACDCRKPRPGMIVRAAREHGIDLSGSWMIGDILNDVEAGNAAGCRTVLIDNGNETEWVKGPGREPTLVAKSVLEAALLITGANHLETVPKGTAIVHHNGESIGKNDRAV
jgi:histidinol-phosphate phosphatase family protein